MERGEPIAVRLYCCDRLVKLETVIQPLFNAVQRKGRYSFAITQHYFGAPEISTLAKSIESNQPENNTLAVMVVHAHESRLSINESNAGIGYGKIYKALQSLTGDRVLVIIAHDSDTKYTPHGPLLAPWINQKISIQFTPAHFDGTHGFVMSFDKQHQMIHEMAIQHICDHFEAFGQGSAPPFNPPVGCGGPPSFVPTAPSASPITARPTVTSSTVSSAVPYAPVSTRESYGTPGQTTPQYSTATEYPSNRTVLPSTTNAYSSELKPQEDYIPPTFKLQLYNCDQLVDIQKIVVPLFNDMHSKGEFFIEVGIEYFTQQGIPELVKRLESSSHYSPTNCEGPKRIAVLVLHANETELSIYEKARHKNSKSRVFEVLKKVTGDRVIVVVAHDDSSISQNQLISPQVQQKLSALSADTNCVKGLAMSFGNQHQNIHVQALSHYCRHFLKLGVPFVYERPPEEQSTQSTTSFSQPLGAIQPMSCSCTTTQQFSQPIQYQLQGIRDSVLIVKHGDIVQSTPTTLVPPNIQNDIKRYYSSYPAVKLLLSNGGTTLTPMAYNEEDSSQKRGWDWRLQLPPFCFS